MQLARLFVDTFEIGARKAELDIGDEVCRSFGIALDELEDRYRGTPTAGLDDSEQQRLRHEVAVMLAERASSSAALMTTVAKSGAKFIQRDAEAATDLVAD